MNVWVRSLGAAALFLLATPAVAGAPSLNEVRSRHFEVVTVDGERIPLTDLLPKGRPAVVEFWATWCAPCRKTIPHLVELSRRDDTEKLVILALSIEDPATSGDKVRRFVADEGVSFPVAFASPELYRFMNEREEIGVPKVLVYDKAGEVVEHIIKYSPLTRRKIMKSVRRVTSEGRP